MSYCSTWLRSLLCYIKKIIEELSAPLYVCVIIAFDVVKILSEFILFTRQRF